MNWKKWPWFFLGFLVLLLDQLTKQWALLTLNPYEAKPIIPFLNLTLAFNTGASFGFLSGFSVGWTRWFFIIISLVLSFVFSIWLIRLPVKDRLQSFAISLILGGALGNLYDRLVLGHVIDFIDVYYKNFHWPVFNLADSAICLGAFCLMICLGKGHGSDSSI